MSTTRHVCRRACDRDGAELAAWVGEGAWEEAGVSVLGVRGGNGGC